MIIMSVTLDNIYSFKNFKINFSYPKKIRNSNIDYEYLEERKNFRFKRLNIIMGSNSSGKTTLGLALMIIYNFLFLDDNSLCQFKKTVKNKELPSFFEIHFADSKKYHLLVIKCKFLRGEILELSLDTQKIGKNDSYEQVLKKINNNGLNSQIFYKKGETNEHGLNYFFHYIHKQYNSSWFFINPRENDFDINPDGIYILENILKSLDPNIESITNIENKNIFSIKMKEGVVMIQNGKIIDDSILSSGTKEGIHIGNILYNIIIDKKYNRCRTYYIDEKFAYIHTELEKKLLSMMIELLPKTSQLFFTTHNSDILDFNVPIHSFIFLKKEENNIEIINPEKHILSNDRKLKKYIENDVFSTQPSTRLLNKLLATYQE